MHITREEVLKIASISKIEIQPDEIEDVLLHLQSVLEYAARVSEVVADVYEPSNKNLNVVREDVVSKTDPETILSQAPQREEDYFEVPSILKNS
ncbi:MAG TPA: Asp-tRNA(Asn)/Glu-tRNA(Gln) amidotransferase subunit GatC [Candidatus Babeliales bacterium]|nr:Asp-tRNA(Asn)/Glu-tRNA(Gln) amidotransferase subunit GatC [Candidatus Babeliales bacterium]